MVEEALIFSKKTALEYRRDQEEDMYLGEEDLEAMKRSHEQHHTSLEKVKTALEDKGVSYSESSPADSEGYGLAVVAGGDGTLLDSHPCIDDALTMTVNTDPERSDGGLHRFDMKDFGEGLDRVLSGDYEVEEWTRLEAELDEEKGIALNELYIGPDRTGGVAEYRIDTGTVEESHRNSGMIVSTGRGSTGWYKNIYSDIHGEEKTYDPESDELRYISWQNIDEIEAPKGVVKKDEELVVRSEMNYGGTVKFDGDRRPVKFPRGREIRIRKGEPLRIVV